VNNNENFNENVNNAVAAADIGDCCNFEENNENSANV
jgi:hypothetical protein